MVFCASLMQQRGDICLNRRFRLRDLGVLCSGLRNSFGANEFGRDNVSGCHIQVILIRGCQIQTDLPIEIFLMITDQG